MHQILPNGTDHLCLIFFIFSRHFQNPFIQKGASMRRNSLQKMKLDILFYDLVIITKITSFYIFKEIKVKKLTC
jgi:hypothetical protein